MELEWENNFQERSQLNKGLKPFRKMNRIEVRNVRSKEKPNNLNPNSVTLFSYLINFRKRMSKKLRTRSILIIFEFADHEFEKFGKMRNQRVRSGKCHHSFANRTFRQQKLQTHVLSATYAAISNVKKRIEWSR